VQTGISCHSGPPFCAHLMWHRRLVPCTKWYISDRFECVSCLASDSRSPKRCHHQRNRLRHHRSHPLSLVAAAVEGPSGRLCPVVLRALVGLHRPRHLALPPRLRRGSVVVGGAKAEAPAHQQLRLVQPNMTTILRAANAFAWNADWDQEQYRGPQR
jgi:hypothetical protein